MEGSRCCTNCKNSRFNGLDIYCSPPNAHPMFNSYIYSGRANDCPIFSPKGQTQQQKDLYRKLEFMEG